LRLAQSRAQRIREPGEQVYVCLMSTGNGRSLELIERNDLLRLVELAEQAEQDLFTRKPRGAGRYKSRLLCRALCQGSALHYVDGTNGVKDFDVWSFYAALDSGPFPYRWVGSADFGPSRFGRYPKDPGRYVGRRVDILGRSLPAGLGSDPNAVLSTYLTQSHTTTAKALAEKAVVLLSPLDRVGEIVWPPGVDTRHPVHNR
jgi:hypothetical protein